MHVWIFFLSFFPEDTSGLVLGLVTNTSNGCRWQDELYCTFVMICISQGQRETCRHVSLMNEFTDRLAFQGCGCVGEDDSIDNVKATLCERSSPSLSKLWNKGRGVSVLGAVYFLQACWISMKDCYYPNANCFDWVWVKPCAGLSFVTAVPARCWVWTCFTRSTCTTTLQLFLLLTKGNKLVFQKKKQFMNLGVREWDLMTWETYLHRHSSFFPSALG